MLVQYILVGNYEPIMRICGKIFTINLRNLQMLFLLWIKTKFSECLPPLHKHECTPWKTFWRRFCQGPQTQGGFGDSYPQIFCVPQILLFSEKFVSNMIKIKIFPHKIVFCPPKPQNLATDLVLPKLRLRLEYFALKSIRPRDVA